MMANVSLVIRSLILFFILFIPLSCTTDENESEAGLQLSTSTLVLGENGRGEVVVSVAGKGTYTLDFTQIPEWLSVGYSNSDGSVTRNGLTLDIVADSSLLAGTYTGVITIVADGAGTISFTVDYNKQANNLAISEIGLDFGYLENELSFEVRNLGGQNFSWEIINTNSFITYEPSAGGLNSGGTTLVKATIDRGALSGDILNATVSVRSDIQQIIEQSVSINYFLEEKILLSGAVVDVEYDRINDVMIVVSTSPNQISKYDPKTGQITSLNLNMPPNCVSIGSNGTFAAVGHNARFSHVNLQTMQLEKMYEASCDASDIVLAPNNWVYVFQKEYQGSEFRCIRLSDGIETLSIGWGYYNSKAKLHPSGKYLYIANNGLSPSDFDKYDITDGTAARLYDSPYHGDFDFAGNIWINEGGDRLFARSRNVFDATEDQATDMRYDGVLEGSQMIAAMDIHTHAKKLYAILETGDGWPKIPSNTVSIYDSEYLTYQSNITLPGFLKGKEDEHPGFYDSEGHFGFFNRNGSQFYVVVKTKSNYDPYDASDPYSPDDWAIVTVPVN